LFIHLDSQYFSYINLNSQLFNLNSETEFGYPRQEMPLNDNKI